jgi:hypothetical protein
MYLSVGCLVVNCPPEEGQTVVTETCRVLIMCFKNIFNNFSVLNVNIVVLKRVHEFVLNKISILDVVHIDMFYHNVSETGVVSILLPEDVDRSSL